MEDIYIAVIGTSGSGKSTFISLCSGHVAPIGHDLQSCTAVVREYSFKWDDNTTVHLFDTPGFDGTNQNDGQVVREIAGWLTQSFSNDLRLNGIVYLHRMTDSRLHGSVKRNLVLFNKLCGARFLKNVVLVSTMWDRVHQIRAFDQEKQLITTPELWGFMVKQGSLVYRLTGTKDSALQVIENFIDSATDSSIILDIQREMFNEYKDLNQTSVGIELNRELAQAEAAVRKLLSEVESELKIAILDRDETTQHDLAQERSRYLDDLERLGSQQQQLKITMDDLHRAKNREIQEVTRQQQDPTWLQREETLRQQCESSKQLLQSRVGEHTLVSDLGQYRGRFKSSQWVTYGSEGSYIARTESGGTLFYDGRAFVPKSRWARDDSDVLVYAAIHDAENFFCVLADPHGTTCYNVSRVTSAGFRGGRGPLGAWIERRSRESGPEIMVAFGPDDSFVATTVDGDYEYYLFPNAKMALEEVYRRDLRLDHVALGYGGCYIFADSSNGWSCWGLSRMYLSLDRFLGARMKERQGILAASLNSWEGHFYVALEREYHSSSSKEIQRLLG